MDELTLLRRHGDEFGPQLPEPSTGVTEDFLALTRTPTGRLPRSGRLDVRSVIAHRGVLRRPLLWTVPVGAVAVSVGLVVTGALPLTGSDQAGTGRPTPQATQAIGSGRPTVNLDARSILLAAAAQARSQPDQVPDKNSYVYSRSTTSTRVDVQGKKENGRDTREVWLAVDGGKPGLSISAGRERAKRYRLNLAVCPDKPKLWGGSRCGGPGHLADMPKDPDGALAELRRARPGMFGWIGECQGGDTTVSCRPSTDVDVFNNAVDMLTARLMPSASRAAIFEALSTLPRVSVVPGTTTIAGRSGVGLLLDGLVSGEGYSSTMRGVNGRFLVVLDRATYDVVGHRLELRDPKAAGKVVASFETATQPIQVVDQLGVRPDGSEVDWCRNPHVLTPGWEECPNT